MSDLPFTPQQSSGSTRKPRVLKASFGDGYEQRTADGLNTIRDEWHLTWNLNALDRDTLLNFFSNLNGVSSFGWQSPDSISAKRYVCDDWSYTPLSGQMSQITAHIYQVFEL